MWLTACPVESEQPGTEINLPKATKFTKTIFLNDFAFECFFLLMQVHLSETWRDSYGTSCQVVTPNGAERQEAHRAPHGKRATRSEKSTTFKEYQ
jgi:hypothetical protein